MSEHDLPGRDSDSNFQPRRRLLLGIGFSALIGGSVSSIAGAHELLVGPIEDRIGSTQGLSSTQNPVTSLNEESRKDRRVFLGGGLIGGGILSAGTGFIIILAASQ